MTDHNHRSDILFAAMVIVLMAAAWYVRDVLLLVYVAALFAVVLGPAVSAIRRVKIRRWRPSRGFAVLTIMLGVLLGVGLLVLFIAPPIVRDIQAFSKDLPGKLQRLQEHFRSLPLAGRFNPYELQNYATGAVGGAMGLFRGIAGGVFGFVSFVVLLAYFIIDGERAFYWSLMLVPEAGRERLQRTLERAEGRVSKWLLGQLALMALLGTASGITFGLLHVKYAFALGVFAGLANIIPIIGPILSAVLATSVAAFDSWTKAGAVIVFYTVYQQLENAFLTPKIMKSTVNLPALTVIIALAIGGTLAGVAGALVAVPTAALIAVLVDEYVVKESS